MPESSTTSSTSPDTDVTTPESPEEPKSKRSIIEQHIEDITSLFPKAINERDFDPEKQPWNLLAKSFRAEIPYFRQHEKLDPGEYVAFWRDFTAQHPDFRVEVVHTDVFVSKKADMAECYMTWKSNSQNPDLFISATSKVTWRRERKSGDWFSTNHVSLPGMTGID